jgi:NAD(P)-dependent dehydrogenase (short-subunit alcohol dehydrogenase family)
MNPSKLKTALITGGASGIGAETVRLFCSNGYRCVIADVQDDLGQALAAELDGAAIYQHMDVTSERDVQRGVERVLSEFGRLDCLFNNAGFIGAVGPITDIPLAEFERTLAVLFGGPFLGMKYAATAMKEQHSGVIINCASICGLQAGISPHIYSAAKAAVIHLTKSVALELAEHGVRVNAICPGIIATPLVEKTLLGEAVSDAQTKLQLGESLKNYQPIPRAGATNDIAQCALWLAGEGSQFITGQALVVDGGATAGIPWSQQPEIFKTHRPL